MKVKLDHPRCEPFKKHHYDAGFDLVNANEEIKLGPYSEALVHTGVYAEIPEGYVGIVVPRSSLGRAGLVMLNTVGIIDSHYRGEIMVAVKNVKSDSMIKIGQFDRFAQLVLVPVFLPEIEVVDELSETKRGTGGFGSTGK